MGRRKTKHLGRSLTRSRNAKKSTHSSEIHNEHVGPSTNQLQSIIEQNNLDEYISYTQLANRDYTAERGTAMTLIVDNEVDGVYDSTEDGVLQSRAKHLQQNRSLMQQVRAFGDLPIPRRPIWESSMSKQQLHSLEREAFLSWRRDLSQLEEDPSLILTPFEKNLEVWRQLWRVVERCHVLVQILDARNPLTFHNRDLEKYVSETDQDKKCIILLNKADLLSPQQRMLWATYFFKKKIPFIFFSAKQERDKIFNTESERIESDQTNFDNTDISTWSSPHESDPTHILNREELLCFFKSYLNNVNINQKALMYQKNQGKPRVLIGMVGYPNVGKSSVINVLTGFKIVTVSSTPGKTKHFQTILIGESIMLCDCPGLVFPSISTTREDMVVDGILPIDQLREHLEPMALLCRRIPRIVFEILYGIKIPDEFPNSMFTSVDALLSSYCKSKNLMSHGGVPNGPQAARQLLKDYVDGKLLYCHPPPNISEEEFDTIMIDEDSDSHKQNSQNDETEDPDHADEDSAHSSQQDRDSDLEEDGELIDLSDDEDTYSDTGNVQLSMADRFNQFNVSLEQLEIKREQLEQRKNKLSKRQRRARRDLSDAKFVVAVEDGEHVIQRAAEYQNKLKNERRREFVSSGKHLLKNSGKQRLERRSKEPAWKQLTSPIYRMQQEYIHRKAMERIEDRKRQNTDFVQQ